MTRRVGVQRALNFADWSLAVTLTVFVARAGHPALRPAPDARRGPTLRRDRSRRGDRRDRRRRARRSGQDPPGPQALQVAARAGEEGAPRDSPTTSGRTGITATPPTCSPRARRPSRGRYVRRAAGRCRRRVAQPAAAGGATGPGRPPLLRGHLQPVSIRDQVLSAATLYPAATLHRSHPGSRTAVIRDPSAPNRVRTRHGSRLCGRDDGMGSA